MKSSTAARQCQGHPLAGREAWHWCEVRLGSTCRLALQVSTPSPGKHRSQVQPAGEQARARRQSLPSGTAALLGTESQRLHSASGPAMAAPPGLSRHRAVTFLRGHRRTAAWLTATHSTGQTGNWNIWNLNFPTDLTSIVKLEN